MAWDQVVPTDTTSKIIEVMVRDSTTGMGKTGLAYGSVVFSYWREGAATGVTATCVTMSLGTWATKGWIEVDATNQKGVYQFGIPNLALAAGVGAVTINFQASGMIDKSVRILLSSPTRGLASPTSLPDAAAGASSGLPLKSAANDFLNVANLPQVAAGAATGLPLMPASGNLPVNTTHVAGTAQTAGDFLGVWTPTKAGYLTGTVSTLTQTQVSGGAYDLTNATFIAAFKSALGTVPASGNWATVGAAMTLANGSIVTATFGTCVPPAPSGMSTLTQSQVSGGAYDLTNATYVAALKSALGTMPASGNWNTVTPDPAGTGAAIVSTLASAHGAGSWATATGFSTHSAADVWSVGARVLTANTNLGLPASWPASWPANWSWSTHSAADVWSAVTRTLTVANWSTHSAADVVTAIGTGSAFSAIPWNAAWDTEVQSECTDALNAYDPPTKAEVDALLTTAMTESYAVDGVAPTPAQALFLIQQALTEFVIFGTTITIKKLDGAATAATLTLDSATAPTSSTRAT